MRKAWITKRRRNGKVDYYVFWYDASRRMRSKKCQNSAHANRFRMEKEAEINNPSDVADPSLEKARTPWPELTGIYLHHKGEVQGREPATIKAARDTYQNFLRIIGPIQAQHVNKQAIHDFIAARRKEDTSPATINKDLRHLKMLVRWAIGDEYMGLNAVKIKWNEIRQTEVKSKPRIASTTELLRVLYTAKHIYGMHWYLRIVLAIATGIRQQDIERLTVSDVNTADATFASLNKKAHRFDQGKPMHQVLTRLLADYIKTLPKSQKCLWPDTYHRSKWERIKRLAGVDPRLKYHSFRATFVNYILCAGYSTSVAQDLVEHSTPNLTHQVYSDMSPVYQEAINSIPLAEMGKAIEQAERAGDNALNALDELARDVPVAMRRHRSNDT